VKERAISSRRRLSALSAGPCPCSCVCWCPWLNDVLRLDGFV